MHNEKMILKYLDCLWTHCIQFHTELIAILEDGYFGRVKGTELHSRFIVPSQFVGTVFDKASGKQAHFLKLPGRQKVRDGKNHIEFEVVSSPSVMIYFVEV